MILNINPYLASHSTTNGFVRWCDLTRHQQATLVRQMQEFLKTIGPLRDEGEVYKPLSSWAFYVHKGRVCDITNRIKIPLEEILAEAL